MIAHHPITGKPIRVMKTETHLYKNQKTLVWLQKTPDVTPDANRFCRWGAVVTDYTLVEAWSTILNGPPTVVLITESSADVQRWLRTAAPKNASLLFLSKEVMNAYGVEQFTKDNFQNVVCLEEMAEMFPHVFHNYTQNEDLSLTVLAVAAVLRVSRCFGFSEASLTDVSFNRYASQLKEAYGLQVGGYKTPEPLWLIQQYYDASKAIRSKEIKKCLLVNLSNPLIDRVVLLNEMEYTNTLPKSDKLHQHILGTRLMYSDVIRYIQDVVPPDVLVVFANSDIYLDESWRQIWSLDMSNVFLSLLRYEVPTEYGVEPALFGPRADSQDTWVVSSSAVKSRKWTFQDLEFQFGRAGCDNAINVEMLRKKFVVANPALSLKTIHCHTSQVRSYNPKDVVDKPMFLYLEPTGLHDLEPTADLSAAARESLPTPSPFSRRINSADDRHTKTFCRMTSRDKKICIEPNSDNIYQPQQDDFIYEFKNAFTTPTGLVYGYDKLYIGKHASVRNQWTNTLIHTMTPSIGVREVLAAPLSDETVKDTFSYIQQYMTRILQLKAAGYSGDMWLPRETPRLQEFLQFFKWDEKMMPVIPRDKNIVSFGERTTFLTPRSSNLITKEDVEALRGKLLSYGVATPKPKRIVILQDDTILSSEDVLALESTLETLGYDVQIMYPSRSSVSYILQKMLGAGFCITPVKFENLFWLLPKGAHIIEIMPELDIRGEGAHTAGAASLDYWVTLIPRAAAEARRTMLVERVVKNVVACVSAGGSSGPSPAPAPDTSSNDKKDIPTLYIPTGYTDIHAHSGDTFREMAEIWEERGYVRIIYSTLSPYCWLNRIGDLLLYDRTTFDWLMDTPATYHRLLAGNPDAKELKSVNAKPWSFWPRHPKYVEAFVDKGPLPTYEMRTDTFVFYGKVENVVQQSYRNNELFKACDEFDMPVGSDATYKFGPDEYLHKLANAKFGLCLAGFGNKCNREIECFALGTVPVAAPDVDMSNYKNPPQVGVHYIRLTSYDPEEATRAIQAVSQEEWQKMSAAAHQWWKDNASAMGLWRVTCELSQNYLA